MAGARTEEAIAPVTDDVPYADDRPGYPRRAPKVLLADVEGACSVVRIRFARGAQC